MLKDDIKKVKDQGKLFERLSSDYDAGRNGFSIDSCISSCSSIALQKNADASKTKRTWKDP